MELKERNGEKGEKGKQEGPTHAPQSFFVVHAPWQPAPPMIPVLPQCLGQHYESNRKIQKHELVVIFRKQIKYDKFMTLCLLIYLR